MEEEINTLLMESEHPVKGIEGYIKKRETKIWKSFLYIIILFSIVFIGAWIQREEQITVKKAIQWKTESKN